MEAASGRLRLILGNLRVACDALSDAQLMERFVAARDEAAFATLMRRHGPMVLGVCRRLLHHTQDAEDVFQATFLVLARKARSILQREAIGGWLYRVAYRTAHEARAMRARRQTKEKPLEPTHEPTVGPAELQDWRSILDDELSRLAPAYQAAIVLCDLEARPRKEVAQQLGIPEGTLSSRLANGRKRVAQRLARRGVTFGGAATAGLLTEGATACVPNALMAQTARIAALCCAGDSTTIPAAVAALMKGAMQTMFTTKLKVAAGVLLVAVLGFGVGGVHYAPVGAQNLQPEGKPLSEIDALRKKNELLKLNLQIVLEKVRSQEAELRTLKDRLAGKDTKAARYERFIDVMDLIESHHRNQFTPNLEATLERLRSATTDGDRDRVIEEFQKAVRGMRREPDARKQDGAPKQ